MGSKRSVTVVIPAYNRAASLSRCLEGVADQTCPVELIVVDDGSTDDTPRVLEEFRRSHPDLRFRWARHPSNRGANHARNLGARMAEGDVVVFLDSDAVPRRDWIERLVAGFTDASVAAVTGRVEDPEPTNVWELAYRGTNRVHPRAGEAGRIVAGNLAVRRDLLLACPLDEDLKYGCNEEGIFLRLRALGYSQRLAPEAVIVHEHPYDRREFFHRARVLGRASAWLVYKYRLPPRLDLLPFLLGYALLPLGAAGLPWLVPSAGLFGAGIGALVWNDLGRKGKSPSETLRSLPAWLAFYHVKLVTHVVEAIRLRLRANGVERIRLGRWARASRLRHGT